MCLWVLPRPALWDDGSARDGSEWLWGTTMSELVVASLLAGTLGVGQPGWIGVEYTIAPGWHIYWKNPGQSGIPTEVTPTLPEGWSAGEAVYPGPHRFMMPGELVNYGYADAMTLLIPVTAASEPAGTITVATRWLVCREEQCVPGRATLTLELPSEPTLDEAQAQAPLPASLPEDARQSRSTQGLSLHVPGLSLLEVFPDTEAERAVLQAAVQGEHARIWFKEEPVAGSTLVVRGEQDGAERFYRVTL